VTPELAVLPDDIVTLSTRRTVVNTTRFLAMVVTPGYACSDIRVSPPGTRQHRSYLQ